MARTYFGSPVLILESPTPSPTVECDQSQGGMDLGGTSLRDFNPLNYQNSSQIIRGRHRYNRPFVSHDVDALTQPITFTEKPLKNINKPCPLKTEGTQTLDDDFVVVNSELAQEDLPDQEEETFFQRLRRLLLTSTQTGQQSPYITIPVVAISLASFSLD